MGRYVLAAVVASMLAGCGGSDPPDPGAPLDAGFAKTWSGSLSRTCAGLGTTVYPGGSLPITVSGYSLYTRLGCPDGTTLAVTATGSGSTATWTGTFSCPPAPAGTCPNAVFTRTSVTFTLNGNGTLSASGVGTMVGCGTTANCTTSFEGI
jgi:hypothetical protein